MEKMTIREDVVIPPKAEKGHQLLDSQELTKVGWGATPCL